MVFMTPGSSPANVAREEIFGRDQRLVERHGKAGCAYMGKVVSYPAGRYEEVGSVFLDITSPHEMLVVGKRGTGKSYTLGVLMEGFGLLEEEYRRRIAVLAVDTMSVFHSLKRANTNEAELSRLRDFWDESPRGLEGYVRIFMPQLSIDALREGGQSVHYDDVLQLPLADVEPSDWLTVFDLKPTEPAGVLLIRVIDDLQRRGEAYGYEDIYGEIERQGRDDGTRESLAGLFRLMEGLKVFDKEGTPYREIVKGGQLSVLDISYLGRIGGFDVRNLLIAIIGRRLLQERTLYTTLEMQSEAGLIEDDIAKDIALEHPLVYMLIDEAHLFLPAHAKTLATDVLVDWIKLGRHPGLSLIMATQEPSALHESAIRQADLIIAHNVTSRDDIDALGKAKQSFMTGKRDIQTLVSTMEFRRGLAVIFDDKTRKMEMCRVRPRLTLHTGVDASAIPRETQPPP
jgi:hypothetical protein